MAESKDSSLLDAIAYVLKDLPYQAVFGKSMNESRAALYNSDTFKALPDAVKRAVVGLDSSYLPADQDAASPILTAPRELLSAVQAITGLGEPNADMLRRASQREEEANKRANLEPPSNLTELVQQEGPAALIPIGGPLKVVSQAVDAAPKALQPILHVANAILQSGVPGNPARTALGAAGFAGTQIALGDALRSVGDEKYTSPIWGNNSDAVAGESPDAIVWEDAKDIQKPAQPASTFVWQDAKDIAAKPLTTDSNDFVWQDAKELQPIQWQDASELVPPDHTMRNTAIGAALAIGTVLAGKHVLSNWQQSKLLKQPTMMGAAGAVDEQGVSATTAALAKGVDQFKGLQQVAEDVIVNPEMRDTLISRVYTTLSAGAMNSRIKAMYDTAQFPNSTVRMPTPHSAVIQAVTDLKNSNPNDFDLVGRILHSLTSIDQAKRNNIASFPVAQVQADIAVLRANRPELFKLVDAITANNRAVIDYLHERGWLSSRSYANLRNEMPNYSPTAVKSDVDVGDAARHYAPDSVEHFLERSGAPIPFDKAENPLDLLDSYYQSSIRVAELNDIRRRFVDMMQISPKWDKFVRTARPEEKGAIPIWRDGKLSHVFIKDPIVREGLVVMPHTQDKVLNAISSATKFFQNLTTHWNPTFIPRMLQYELGGALLTRHGNLGVGAVDALNIALGQKPLSQAINKLGGFDPSVLLTPVVGLGHQAVYNTLRNTGLALKAGLLKEKPDAFMRLIGKWWSPTEIDDFANKLVDAYMNSVKGQMEIAGGFNAFGYKANELDIGNLSKTIAPRHWTGKVGQYWSGLMNALAHSTRTGIGIVNNARVEQELAKALGSDPRIVGLYPKISQAFARGDIPTATRLQLEAKQLTNTIKQEAMMRMTGQIRQLGGDFALQGSGRGAIGLTAQIDAATSAYARPYIQAMHSLGKAMHREGVHTVLMRVLNMAALGFGAMAVQYATNPAALEAENRKSAAQRAIGPTWYDEQGNVLFQATLSQEYRPAYALLSEVLGQMAGYYNVASQDVSVAQNGLAESLQKIFTDEVSRKDIALGVGAAIDQSFTPPIPWAVPLAARLAGKQMQGPAQSAMTGGSMFTTQSRDRLQSPLDEVGTFETGAQVFQDVLMLAGSATLAGVKAANQQFAMNKDAVDTAEALLTNFSYKYKQFAGTPALFTDVVSAESRYTPWSVYYSGAKQGFTQLNQEFTRVFNPTGTTMQPGPAPATMVNPEYQGTALAYVAGFSRMMSTMVEKHDALLRAKRDEITAIDRDPTYVNNPGLRQKAVNAKSEEYNAIMETAAQYMLRNERALAQQLHAIGYQGNFRFENVDAKQLASLPAPK